jgi:hypothetical protein
VGMGKSGRRMSCGGVRGAPAKVPVRPGRRKHPGPFPALPCAANKTGAEIRARSPTVDHVGSAEQLVHLESPARHRGLRIRDFTAPVDDGVPGIIGVV